MMKKIGTQDAILTGYFPGVVGKITELHAVYYYEHWGFDVTFETQVARELSELISDFHDERDGLWIAAVKSSFDGAIAIDGRLTRTEGARLRWFIVDPGSAGQGIGTALIKRSLEFCKEVGHKRVFLWTFEGLDAARQLYEKEGFRLTEEHEVDQWGRRIKEQKFVLDL